MDQAISISQRVRQLRTLKGYSQEAVSVYLNVSLRQYQRLESGSRDWRLRQLIEVSELLEVSPAFLINIDLPLFDSIRKASIQFEIDEFFCVMLDRIDELKELCTGEFANKKPSPENSEEG